MPDAMIEITNLTKVFRPRRSSPITAIDSINLTIYEGEFLCIVGPSGCGKTTLLRILAELERQSMGAVTISAKDDSTPLTSMVFQDQSVFPWMTVEDNVAYGLRMRNMDKKQARKAVEPYLDLIGLRSFARSYPHQLSGGMKQRVSVARAFAVDPQILLMDEPFGLLDEQTRLILQQELLRIWEKTRKTAIFVTHNIDEALALGDRVLVMSARPGTIKAIYNIDIPRPRDVAKLRSTPHYIDLYLQVSSIIRDEVQKAQASQMHRD